MELERKEGGQNMAELILTEQEQQSETYLQWDNEALGMAVKKLALGILDHKGDRALAYTACATMLACMAADKNAETTIVELSGVVDGGKQHGDWTLTICRNAAKAEAASKVVGRIHRQR